VYLGNKLQRAFQVSASAFFSNLCLTIPRSLSFSNFLFFCGKNFGWCLKGFSGFCALIYLFIYLFICGRLESIIMVIYQKKYFIIFKNIYFSNSYIKKIKNNNCFQKKKNTKRNMLAVIYFYVIGQSLKTSIFQSKVYFCLYRFSNVLLRLP
jgi:hypothetical protein